MSIAGSLISGLFGIGQQAWQNAYNSKEAEKNRTFQSEEAEKARVFNSSEAALQREWSAAEAEQARDWQEEMYAKYNSLSGKISQAEEAGVNPMLAITGQAVSPMTATSSAPSGASASGSPSPSGSAATNGMLNILGAILDGAKLKSEIDLNKSQAQKNIAEAEGQNITNAQLHDMNAAEILSKLSNVELNNANIELIASKILNTDSDTALKNSQLGLVAAQIANTEADTDVKIKQLEVMTSEIVKNTKDLDVMSAQIALMASNAGLNRAKAAEIGQSIRNMIQQYNHNDVMNELSQMIASSDATHANYVNPANYTGLAREVRQFLNEFKEIFSFGLSNKK